MLPLGYTVTDVFHGGGDPYGNSYTSGIRVGDPDRDTIAVALAQGHRLAQVAQVIGDAQDRGRLGERGAIRIVGGSSAG